MFCNSFLLLSTGCNHFFLILIVSTTVEPLCLLAYSVVTNRPVPASLPRLMAIVFGIIKHFTISLLDSYSLIVQFYPSCFMQAIECPATFIDTICMPYAMLLSKS